MRRQIKRPLSIRIILIILDCIMTQLVPIIFSVGSLDFAHTQLYHKKMRAWYLPRSPSHPFNKYQIHVCNNSRYEFEYFNEQVEWYEAL